MIATNSTKGHTFLDSDKAKEFIIVMMGHSIRVTGMKTYLMVSAFTFPFHSKRST